MGNRQCPTACALLAMLLATPSATSFHDERPPDKDKHYPRQVLLIRHAEKPPDDMASIDLTPQGKERADALPQLFQSSENRPSPFATPSFLFAAKNTKHSHRPLETVTPLARKLKLTVNTDYENEDFAKLVHELFHNPRYADQTTLICWHHGTIPQLARQFKAANVPLTWKGAVFDRVWEITYDERGATTFRDRPQTLLPKDSAK